MLDPFEPPLVGHNALRAYLLEAADAERDVDLTIERHWVSGDDGPRRLARQLEPASDDDAKVRQAGFLAAEVAEDGRIGRLRLVDSRLASTVAG